MSAGAKRGGYSKVVFGTTTGLSTSTEITGLLSGTLALSGGENLTQEDAAGRNIQTGFRYAGQINTSAVTSAPIATLITGMKACTDYYFRFYAAGSKTIKVGPVRVALSPTGAAPGELHQYEIVLSGFDEDSTDLVTFES